MQFGRPVAPGVENLADPGSRANHRWPCDPSLAYDYGGFRVPGGETVVSLEICPIGEADLVGAAAAIASGEVFQRYGLSPERAQRLLETAAETIVVARSNGDVVGVALYRIGDLTPIPAYLRILAVREGSRGLGVGLALLRYVEAEAFRTGPNLFLTCVPENRGARRFYERHGYQEVGTLSNLISDGIDEILYRKTLGAIRGYVSHSESRGG